MKKKKNIRVFQVAVIYVVPPWRYNIYYCGVLCFECMLL
jgi:hypothetical protein